MTANVIHQPVRCRYNADLSQQYSATYLFMYTESTQHCNVCNVYREATTVGCQWDARLLLLLLLLLLNRLLHLHLRQPTSLRSECIFIYQLTYNPAKYFVFRCGAKHVKRVGQRGLSKW